MQADPKHTVYISWENTKDDYNGTNHLYLLKTSPDVSTILHKSYLCGMEVSEQNMPITKKAHAILLNNSNRLEPLCPNCCEEFQNRNLYQRDIYC